MGNKVSNNTVKLNRDVTTNQNASYVMHINTWLSYENDWKATNNMQAFLKFTKITLAAGLCIIAKIIVQLLTANGLHAM